MPGGATGLGCAGRVGLRIVDVWEAFEKFVQKNWVPSGVKSPLLNRREVPSFTTISTDSDSTLRQRVKRRSLLVELSDGDG
jgi:hypothetical protein